MATLFDSASLVMIPSGVKEDKLYSIKPTDGTGDFTFTRDADIEATRVNASGLIEKAKVNLLLQSNQFDTTWTNTTSTETGGQAGYDGTNDAWLLNKTTFNGRIEQTISKTGVLTFSVYAKAGTKNWVYLRVDGSGGNHTAYFDLSGSGALGSTSLAIDSAIEAAGNGYYRCSVTFSDTTTIARIYVADGNGDTSGTTGNIYIQDAQVNHGLIAQDYVETTTTAVVEGLTADLPRLDYSGGASCPSLLLEPSRTNLLPNSELISAWNVYSATITENYATSPEGVQNAVRLEGTGTDFIRQNNIVANPSNKTYTSSFWAKNNGGDTTIVIQMNSSGVSTYAKAIDLTDEWQRFEFTQTYSASDTGSLTFRFRQTNTIDCLVYGFQVEEGSYPTSYIPTYGEAANRGVETCSKTGISSVFGTNQGTLFFEGTYGNEANEIYLFAQNSLGSTTTDSIYLQRSGASSVQAQVWNGTSQDAVIVGGSLSIGDTFKVAVGFANNDVVLYLNGVQIGTNTSVTIPTLTALQIGKYPASAADNYRASKPVKQTLLFKTRLTNAELAALTTL